MTISEKSTEKLRKLFFLACLKRVNIEENFDLFKQLFLIKSLKGDNINQNCFSPQSEPHTAKLCFSVVLKHFWGNSPRTSLFCPKSDYLRKEH